MFTHVSNWFCYADLRQVLAICEQGYYEMIENWLIYIVFASHSLTKAANILPFQLLYWACKSWFDAIIYLYIIKYIYLYSIYLSVRGIK